MNNILVYSGIYNFTAESFINAVQEIPAEEELTVRLNSPGGSVFAGWGMIAAITERTGKTILKVDGNASSMAFIMVPFFDYIQALDVTSFMVHRAEAYIENVDDQQMLDNVNKSLRAILEKRLDAEKFKSITGISIADIFELKERRNIWLTAKEAKAVGLIDKVVRLEPKEMQAINENLVAFAKFDFAAEDGTSQGSDDNAGGSNNNYKPKNQKMTLEQFRAENPDLHAQIIQAGVAQERDRVGAFLAFVDIDKDLVVKAVKDGDSMSQTFTAEMTKKAIAAQTLAKIEADSSSDGSDGSDGADGSDEADGDGGDGPTAEAKEKLTYEAQMRKAAGLEDKEV